MPDYNPGLLYQGIDKGLAAFAEAQDEQKNRAREFKSLQEFADSTGIANKESTTPMDLEGLRGIVRAGESNRVRKEYQERRADDNKWREIGAQHQRAQEEQARLGALELGRHHGEMEKVAAQNAAANEGTRTDMIQQRALAEARRAQEDQRLTDFQNLSAPQPTGLSPMAGDAARFLHSLPGEPGSRPDFSQSDPRQSLQPQSIERIAELARTTGAWRHPQYDNYMKDLRLGSGAERDRVPKLVNLGGVDTIYDPNAGNFKLVPPPRESTSDRITNTEPSPEDVPAGHMKQRTPTGWRVIPDKRYWIENVDLGTGSRSTQFNKAVWDADHPKPVGTPGAGAATTPGAAKSKTERATELQKQNPGWTRQQVIDAVNREASR